MREQLAANIGVNLKFYRRNKLLAGVAILFLAIAVLYASGSLLFATSTGRFDLTMQLFTQLTYFAFVFVGAIGLVLVAVQVRGKAVTLILTKPCRPDVWLASAFLSAFILAAVLYAAILALAGGLSVVWKIPFQSGFAFMAIEFFFEAVIAMSFLTFLSMVMHPVLAVIIAVVFNESVFFALRTGLIAAIKYTGGSIALPLLEKLSYIMYMSAPMISPYKEQIAPITESMRVPADQWKYLAYTGVYAITISLMFYLLTLWSLRRKNFV